MSRLISSLQWNMFVFFHRTWLTTDLNFITILECRWRMLLSVLYEEDPHLSIKNRRHLFFFQIICLSVCNFSPYPRTFWRDFCYFFFFPFMNFLLQTTSACFSYRWLTRSIILWRFVVFMQTIVSKQNKLKIS